MRAPSMCTFIPIEWACSLSAATSAAVYTVPSSVLWVIVTTAGWTWCSLPSSGGELGELFRDELAVRGGEVDQLGPAIRSNAPGFVDVDVRAGGADDGVDRPQQRRQAEHVAPGAGEREQGLDAAAEQFGEASRGTRGSTSSSP